MTRTEYNRNMISQPELVHEEKSHDQAKPFSSVADSQEISFWVT